jgi:hypothetical protein
MHTIKQLKQFVALCFCEFESTGSSEKENVSGLKHSGITAFVPCALSFSNSALVCIPWLMFVRVSLVVAINGDGIPEHH